jgi:hypothetical protein
MEFKNHPQMKQSVITSNLSRTCDINTDASSFGMIYQLTKLVELGIMYARDCVLAQESAHAHKARHQQLDIFERLTAVHHYETWNMAPIRRYLRITKHSVLEVRIYLDRPSDGEAWLLRRDNPALPRVIQAVRPLVLPKLREENERAKSKGGGRTKKKGVKDVVVEGKFCPLHGVYVALLRGCASLTVSYFYLFSYSY